ncbi:MAG TPA: branched-chain amino acid ABC transporter substrate-binding protein [Solirubrobacteraceae bacterium]|nr:branched-chain amino acid ABC transporter substrate-binding protein [Solirubrobacteraceae bacterium]
MTRRLRWERRRTAVLLVAIFAIAGAGLTGCGSSRTAPPGNRVPDDHLTIYASLPYSGPSGASGEAALGGARMALGAVGGRIGRYRVTLRTLNDATTARGGWDPGQTSANARQAIRDRTTIAYLGDLNSGATAVSIPVLSRAGVPQVSPASTAVGLTQGGDEASPGEPQKYYPTDRRTFVRVIANDSVQAAVQARLQREAGCRKTYVVDDGEVDGNDAAMSFQVAAKAAHLPVAASDQYDPKASSYASLAQTVAQSGADCILISALPQDNAVALTDQLGRALPAAKLFATAGLAEPAYFNPADGGVSPSLGGRLVVTVATLSDGDYPPAGRRFLAAYARRYGGWQPDAIYGYEAMSLILDAVSRATGHGTRPAVRSAVTRALFATRDRHSVLGTYGITRLGDTTLRLWGVYRVENGRLAFWKAMSG